MIQRRIAAQKAKAYRIVVKDRAKADDKVFAHFAKQLNGCFKDHWTDENTEKMILHWHLGFICTLPKYQGKGYGTKLVRWGTDQADKDRLLAGVNASPRAMCLYGPNGFERIGDLVLPEGNGVVCRRPKKSDDA